MDNDSIDTHASPSWSIGPLPTRKDRIKQPPAAEAGVIPLVNTCQLFCGATASGKSNLMVTLLTDKRFYGGKKTFDRFVLISPTAYSDDVQGELSSLLEDEDIVDDLSKAPAFIRALMDEQNEAIEESGPHRAPLVALILDDCVGDVELMKSPEFIRVFVGGRHFNISTIFCTQSYTALKRKCRLQATNIFFFKGNHSETEKIAEEYAPPGFSKKRFKRLVEFGTKEPFSFLFINKNKPFDQRYRKNLGEIIVLDSVPE